MKFDLLKFSWFLFVLTLLFSGVNAQNKELMPKFPNGAKILFQGDSITDGGRGRNADPNHIMADEWISVVNQFYFGKKSKVKK
jgi:hypothetical protein